MTSTRTKIFIYALFLTPLLTPCTLALAEPTITTTTQYYDIQGKTKDELRNAMQRSAPRSTGGEHDASTEWNTHWNYKSGDVGGGCGVTSYQLSMEIIFHMPRWPDAESMLGFGLKGDWAKFVKALQLHEDGHAKIAKECIYEMEKAIQHVGTVQNCGELQGKMSNAVSTVQAKYRQKEFEYDAQTDHGMKQGAIW